MAKVKVKGINTLEATLRKKYEKFVNKADEIQEGIVGDLKKEIKSGKSPATGKNFRKLKDSTIESRRRRSKYNKTDASFSPSTSALTFTGQLVDSIKAKIKVGAKSLNITIEPTGKRTSYKNKDGTNTKKSAKIGNKRLAKIHADGGGKLPKRDLLGFTKKKEKEIVKIIKEVLLKALR